MKSTKAFTLIILGIIIFGSGSLFMSTLTHALYGQTEEEMLVPEYIAIGNTEASSTLPVKVVIPAINVSAEVQHVGIGKSGRMAVPTNYADVGWYKYGTVPGRAGNAVVAGHVDNGFGLSGVFNRLSELDKDDEIIVEDRQGQRLVFRVVETRTFDSATEDTEEIFGPSERARLHLITCEGEWIPEKKTYSDRRVVTAQFEKIINTP